MSNNQERAFGMPSIPRQTMPSMFQILSWSGGQHQAAEVKTENQQKDQSKPQATKHQENIVQNASLVQSQYAKELPRKNISKSTNTKYQLYEYKCQKDRRVQSQIHCDTVGSKVVVEKKIVPKKKLDINNETERLQIEARKERIKKFQYVTRDLPNSAFTTYYGKPTFEAYGRGNSNPNLLSHNVMPHRGQNHPKVMQSYYAALLKGKKQSLSTYVPRKPIQEITTKHVESKQQAINLPLQVPDLINNVRFTAQNPRQKYDKKIPSSKMTTMKQKKVKKSARNQKKKKQTKTKLPTDIDDGLKYMNTRENLLNLLDSKKQNSSKLAYKVTECYPYDWQNQEKMKESTKMFEKQKIAGKPSKKGEKVSELLINSQQQK